MLSIERMCSKNECKYKSQILKAYFFIYFLRWQQVDIVRILNLCMEPRLDLSLSYLTLICFASYISIYQYFVVRCGSKVCKLISNIKQILCKYYKHIAFFVEIDATVVVKAWQLFDTHSAIVGGFYPIFL